MLYIIKSSDVSNNYINTIETLKGKFILHSFTFTNNLYNITSNNNILPYQEGATYTAIELTQQFANGNEIATDIQTKINAVSGGIASVTYNSSSGKFTITNTTNFYLKFGDVVTNTANNLLGFLKQNTTNATSVTSNNVAHLIPFQTININIDQDKKKSIKNENYTENTFLITGTSNFGDAFVYVSQNNDIHPQICEFKPTKRIKITFFDENDNELQLNDWVLVLSSLN